ncbi:MAG: zinc ribbon domain-containing protein [Burkholderiales bacterium]
MSRFDQEWGLVPTAARWLAVLVSLAYAALMGAVFLLPAWAAGDRHAVLTLVPIFLLALLGVVPIALWVLLVGYVFGDARRRAMHAVLWTLLAIFIPSGIGIILYFILREPIAVPCPSCGTPARKGHAYCASCGGAVRRACAQCHQPVEASWRNCPSCGASLTAAVQPTASA